MSLVFVKNQPLSFTGNYSVLVPVCGPPESKILTYSPHIVIATMPIIDNQKMACEPCIRGHRSTKCNHANERMMIPVRKPGRPLSICPHPPNNRCSCTSVTAALPRTRRCGGCVSKPGASSGSASASASGPSGPASSAKAVPRSPSKRSFSSKSLQLSNTPAPLGQGQGQFNVSIIGRPDMGMPVNAAPSWPNGSAPTGYGGMPMQPQQDNYMMMQSNEYMPGTAMMPINDGQFQPDFQMPGRANGGPIYAQDQFPAHFPGYSNGLNMSAFGPSLEDYAAGPAANQMNGFHSVQFPAQPQQQPQQPQQPAEAPSSCCAPPPPPQPKRSESSCCGGTANTAASTKESTIESAQITPASSRNSLASNPGTTSCCSDSPTSLSSSFSQHAMLKTESRAGGPIPLSSIPPAPQAPGQSDQAYAHIVANHRLQQHGQPAWYRYAPQFGTAATPLQQSQWRSSLIVMDGHPAAENGMPNAFGDANANTNTAPTNPPYTVVPAPTTADSDGNSHLCSCGDDCNCVGCVAHPYNAATQNAVQAAWQAIDDSSSNASGSGSTRTAKAHVTNVSTPNGITTFQLATSETSSPIQEFTPSDTADDQLSADDFLFVNYSVAGCIGEDLICPCGDDCQCFGCTLHNPPA